MILYVKTIAEKRRLSKIWWLLHDEELCSDVGMCDDIDIQIYQLHEDYDSVAKVFGDIRLDRAQQVKKWDNGMKHFSIVLIDIIGKGSVNLEDYQSLLTLLLEYPNLYCCISNTNEKEKPIYFRNVSAFFSLFLLDDNNSRRLWLSDGMEIWNLKKEKDIKSYRLLPGIVIDFGNNQNCIVKYDFWRSSVADLYNIAFSKTEADFRYMPTFREISDIKGQNSNLASKHRREIYKCIDKSVEWRMLYYAYCYFCDTDRKNIKTVRKIRQKILRKEWVWDYIKTMPFFAFFLFSVRVFFTESVRDETAFIELFVNTSSLAESILQLIENIKHTTSKSGNICFRIYEENTKKYKLFVSIKDTSLKNITDTFWRENGIEGALEPNLAEFFYRKDDSFLWKTYTNKPQNIVHHFGIHTFSMIIKNNGGNFRVISSADMLPDNNHIVGNRCNELEDNIIHIPGTEYVIEWPLQDKNKTYNTAMEPDINYEYLFNKNYYEKPCRIESNSLNKECRINENAKKIKAILNDDAKKEGIPVLSFDRTEGFGDYVEVLCKSLMINILENENEHFYAVIKNCTSADFVTITGYFAVFYGKCYGNPQLDKIQIYLSGEDESEEFIIAGGDISDFLNMAEKMALVRGVQAECLKSISYVMKKFQTIKSVCSSRKINVVPFDMISKEDGSTIFERAVVKVLKRDIQQQGFGCRVNNTHMRVGSKLHIGDFYEAELLFHNNYYVKRFAILIEQFIINKYQKNGRIMLVGYETYSELLLYEIVSWLTHLGWECGYMLYEQQTKDGVFRFFDEDKIPHGSEWMDYQYIIIVPINSSLTTHNKLQAALIRHVAERGCKWSIKGRISDNLALIHIRSQKENDEPDELEKKYFRKGKGKQLITVNEDGEDVIVYYFVSVKTEWQQPLKCRFCFPNNNIEERPIIETNRASIVPRQMIGLKIDFNKGEKQDSDKTEYNEKSSDESKNEKKVEALGRCLQYGHALRNDKHFMFYFRMDAYFQKNRYSIIKWLDEIKENECKQDEKIIFDIIVSPQHCSNAGFVAEVNQRLFQGAALVLNFEIDKEYRDNVRTKFSNITVLYDKLRYSRQPAEILFHYVDDTIITGHTYFRAKSLFSSLFDNVEKVENVKVSVFEDITIILNRMSSSSVHDFMDDEKRFRAYVNLNISSMRNYEDACMLCKVVENATVLRNRSQTNQMFSFWDKRVKRHQLHDASVVRSIDDNGMDRAYRRMICTHNINSYLGELKEKKNDSEEVFVLFSKVLDACIDGAKPIEWIISYIKIMGRPFISYRKSCIEAAFKITLTLADFMTVELVKSKSTMKKAYYKKYEQLSRLCRYLRDVALDNTNQEDLFDLYKVLLQRLSALGSNYIIRKKNIKSIFAFVRKMSFCSEYIDEFRECYITMAKRVIGLSSDENKCIFLEYMLLFGGEYENEVVERKVISENRDEEYLFSDDILLGELLFLENTRVFYDGLIDLRDEAWRNGRERCDADYILSLLDRYYYENFRRLLEYYRIIVRYEEGFRYSEGMENIIPSLLDFLLLLDNRKKDNKDEDIEEFYDRFLSYVEMFTGGRDARLVFIEDEADRNKSGINAFMKRSKNGIEMYEFTTPLNELIYDTYYFDEKADQCILTVQFCDYVGNKYTNDHDAEMEKIYLQVDYQPDVPYRRRIIALKMLLTFRYRIVKNMEMDFSNNLMQKWSSESLFKKNMMLERASDHTDRDDLEEDYNLILRPFREMEGFDKRYLKAFYYLVINSYIARFNAQVLAKSLPEGENEPITLWFVYYAHLRALIENLRFIEGKFYLCDENGEELKGSDEALWGSRLRMVRSEHRCEECLSIKRVAIIIIELIISGIKYSDDRKVYIYRKGNNLVVKNSFISTKTLEQLKEEAKDAYMRKGEGISLAVIKNLVDQFYEGTINSFGEAENAVVNIYPEKEQGKIFYYVELPIFEKSEV